MNNNASQAATQTSNPARAASLLLLFHPQLARPLWFSVILLSLVHTLRISLPSIRFKGELLLTMQLFSARVSHSHEKIRHLPLICFGSLKESTQCDEWISSRDTRSRSGFGLRSEAAVAERNPQCAPETKTQQLFLLFPHQRSFRSHVQEHHHFLPCKALQRDSTDLSRIHTDLHSSKKCKDLKADYGCICSFVCICYETTANTMLSELSCR